MTNEERLHAYEQLNQKAGPIISQLFPLDCEVRYLQEKQRAGQISAIDTQKLTDLNIEITTLKQVLLPIQIELDKVTFTYAVVYDYLVTEPNGTGIQRNTGYLNLPFDYNGDIMDVNLLKTDNMARHSALLTYRALVNSNITSNPTIISIIKH